MSDNQGAGNTIAFTDEHIEAIKKGDKTSTLRTIKKDNFFEEGARIQNER